MTLAHRAQADEAHLVTSRRSCRPSAHWSDFRADYMPRSARPRRAQSAPPHRWFFVCSFRQAPDGQENAGGRWSVSEGIFSHEVASGSFAQGLRVARLPCRGRVPGRLRRAHSRRFGLAPGAAAPSARGRCAPSGAAGPSSDPRAAARRRSTAPHRRAATPRAARAPAAQREPRRAPERASPPAQTPAEPHVRPAREHAGALDPHRLQRVPGADDREAAHRAQDPPDARRRGASSTAPVTAALPDGVDHRNDGTEGPIKDQGQVGSCTSFSLSSAMDNAIRRQNKSDTISSLHIWSHYGYPGHEDRGRRQP